MKSDCQRILFGLVLDQNNGRYDGRFLESYVDQYAWTRLIVRHLLRNNLRISA